MVIRGRIGWLRAPSGRDALWTVTYALQRHASLIRTAFVSPELELGGRQRETRADDDEHKSLFELAQSSPTRNYRSQARRISSASRPGSGEPRQCAQRAQKLPQGQNLLRRLPRLLQAYRPRHKARGQESTPVFSSQR